MGTRAVIVYGDHPRVATVAAMVADVRARLAAARAEPAGLARHVALCGAFVAAAELTQAVADAAFARDGVDGADGDADRALAAMRRLARALAVSWRSGMRRTPVPGFVAVLADGEVAPRTAEGFALYAVYPEAYAGAAAGDLVVGVRSIGVALGAMAAGRRAALMTVRPVGHPFARALRLSGERAAVLRGAARPVVVDEGPGLSGSSMAAVVAALGARATLVTSHGGAPGAMAGAEVRARWAASARRVADFDAAVLPRLPGWVGEVAGAAVTGWADLSGGAWRGGRDLPADGARERRKFRAETARGPLFVKFAGLGAVGEVKLARARALAAAGFGVAPLGLAHGFLVEPWVDGEAPAPGLERVARYLAFRARAFAGGTGAGRAALAAMARANIAEGVGDAVAAALALGAEGLGGAAVAVDGRMHRWEWVGAVKTDAVDHAMGHDLVGCQDIAWDVAGAECELGLGGEALAGAMAELGVEVDARVLAFHRVAYPAFQLGLWTMAGSAEAGRYAAWLKGLAGRRRGAGDR